MSEKKFIKETIVKKQTGRSRTILKILGIAASGVLFGVMAILTLALGRPVLDRYLVPETSKETSPEITIPRDVQTEAVILRPVAPPTTEVPTETAPPPTEPEPTEPTEPVENIVQNALEEYEYSFGVMEQLWEKAAEICEASDIHITDVQSVRTETDLFENEIERTAVFSGIIAAVSDTEVLVLTDLSALDNADELRVKMFYGETAQAQVKQTDRVNGLAVLAVKLEELGAEAKEVYTPVTLGNSFSVKRGDMLVAVGSPREFPHSTAYCWVSYIDKDTDTVDGRATAIYPDRELSGERGVWMLNTAGELIGWVKDPGAGLSGSAAGGETETSAESRKGASVITGISEYKSALERMINGREYPYLGMVVAEQDEAMRESGAPEGVYVKSVVQGGPAYQAGVQPGDILEGIGEASSTSLASFRTAVEGLTPGTAVTLLVHRLGAEEYRDIAFEIVADSRSKTEE